MRSGSRAATFGRSGGAPPGRPEAGRRDVVAWQGEHGRTVFFQNELPYDAPTQAAWKHDGLLGWAGYKVSPSVRTHEL